MINRISNWLSTSGLIEYIGAFVILVVALGMLYLVYEVIKFLANLYIQMKLVELYKQKDRLWDAYQDLYENYDDLKEKTWDYDITKRKLYSLSKDVSDIEEFLLGDYVPEKKEKLSDSK